MHIKKIALIISILLSAIVFSNPSVELNETETKILKDDINSMMALFEKGDAQALIDRTHETALNLYGGKEAFERLTKKAVQDVMKSDIKFLESELGKPSAVHPAGKYEVCFVPRTAIIKINDQKIKAIGFMLAIRTKGKNKWKYIDGSAFVNNTKLLGTLFPDLNPKTVMPPSSMKLLKEEAGEAIK